ncbi:MAG: VWA domain-containing protein [Alphaproteobacteria bacterium]|nr:VWA domain-containing protein [Alphaproteobacteria bacterium]
MWGQLEGTAKIATAKNVLANLMTGLPPDTNVGLMAYGHRAKSDCADVELLSGIGADTGIALLRKIKDISPKGKTPIAASLAQSEHAFDGRLVENNNIILISDGIETCDGDPCKVAGELRTKGINVRVHVVGFNVEGEARRQLECIANAGNGQYFNAESTIGFQEAIQQVQQVAQAEPEPAPAPAPAGPTITEVFRDDFDGDVLGEHWDVLNPDIESYIVEDGFLNVLSSTELTLYSHDDALANVFQLTEPLPDGDWIATMRVLPSITTFRESFSLALYTDKDNFLAATAGSGVNAHAGNVYVHLSANKVTRGKYTSFGSYMFYSEEALGHRNVSQNIAAYSELATRDIQAIVLRVEKVGRSYFVSGKVEGDPTTADSEEGQWVELEKLTALRPPGKFLIISIGQQISDGADKHLMGGETFVQVDWVKIETTE